MRRRSSGLAAADDPAGRLRFLFLDSWVRDRAEGSGSAVAIAGLASGLRSLGHTVEVVRPQRVLRSADLTRFVYNLTLKRRVSDRAPFDILVGFDYDGWALPRAAKARYAVALKGVAADERRFEAGWNRVRFGIWARLEGRNARSATRVFVTSEYSRRRAVEAYTLMPERLRVVPEALDAAAPTGCDRFEGRSAATGPPVVLSVARQYRRKDTATLLAALPAVLERFPDLQVRVVGSGPELPRLRRLAARKGVSRAVVFLGAVDMPTLRSEYERASLFCLPSRQEGFGIVFLEAMSYGLPILAADAGAVPEVAPHGETSLLVPPGDAPALASAISRLLEEPALAHRLGQAGVQRARRYSWENSARVFIDGLPEPEPS